MLNTIFTEGWLLIVLLYGIIFLAARHSVYNLIFKPLAGVPRSGSYEDVRHWHRSNSFFGSVIFAPLFEEFLFTFLAYKSFLSYAQPGKEGIVVLFVAIFFAFLHLPGDLRQMAQRFNAIHIYLLIKFQLNRFFYALAAYFIFKMTGSLWITIAIHAFFNALVSVTRFDLEDFPDSFEGGDGRLRLTLFLNLVFTLVATYYFCMQFPDQALWITLPAGLISLDTLRAYFR